MESTRSAVPGTVRAAAEQAENFLHGTRLTAGMVSAFIENVFVHGVQFVQALLEANGLAAGKDYQFKGRYEAEKNAVIISLEKDEREC